MTFDADASFSHNYLEIIIELTANNGVYLVYLNGDVDYNNNNCQSIFDSLTNDLLSEFSECVFDFNLQKITITLSSMATLTIMDELVINENVFYVQVVGDGTFFNENKIEILSINIDEENGITPQLSLYNFESIIGLCDDLVLDARNSYDLGMFMICSLCVVHVSVFFVCYLLMLQMITHI